MEMDPHSQFVLRQTRRTFLGKTFRGVGSLALASLLNPSLIRADGDGSGNRPRAWQGVVNPFHHPPRIRRVIHLYMAGGPTHLETLDYKPELARLHEQPMPESFTRGQQIAQLQGKKLICLGPQHPFARYGNSGQEICSMFPHIGGIADDICIIRSMVTEQINHDPAHTFMNTGSRTHGMPSMGSWLLYGLGNDSNNLPGFVVLVSVGKGGQAQPIAARQWSSGILPSRFQGVPFESRGDSVLYVSNPQGVSRKAQRQVVDAVQSLNQIRNEWTDDPEVATRINAYELAFRMQTSVPELMDLSGEPQHIMDLYGAKPGDGSFASNCLLARRLAERGVRFIQLYHRGWDMHGQVKKGIEVASQEVDRASAALVLDLKRRGMLEDTLVIWGGEFGRTPMGQGNGRDHHILGFSMWLAGGGIQGGISHGGTDELGYRAVENVVHVRDLHATMLHLFGIDHSRLTFKFQVLHQRLTGVEDARVIDPILL